MRPLNTKAATVVPVRVSFAREVRVSERFVDPGQLNLPDRRRRILRRF
jgi:hypothetical protein